MKPVKIFGKSVPLAVVLLALTVVIAGAAFLGNLLVQGNISGTAATVSGGDMSLVTANCNDSGLGSTTCTKVDNQSFNIVIAGIDDDSMFDLSGTILDNLGEASVEYCGTSGWSYGAVNDPQIGTVIPALTGQINLTQVSFYYDLATPGQVFSGALSVNFAGVGLCP